MEDLRWLLLEILGHQMTIDTCLLDDNEALGLYKNKICACGEQLKKISKLRQSFSCNVKKKLVLTLYRIHCV